MYTIQYSCIISKSLYLSMSIYSDSDTLVQYMSDIVCHSDMSDIVCHSDMSDIVCHSYMSDIVCHSNMSDIVYHRYMHCFHHFVIVPFSFLPIFKF